MFLNIIAGIVLCAFLLITTFRKSLNLPKWIDISRIIPVKMVFYVQSALVACILAMLYMLTRLYEPYSDEITQYSNTISDIGKVNNVAGFSYNPDDPNNIANAANAFNADFGDANTSTQNFQVDNNLVDPSPVYYQPGTFKISDRGGYVPSYDQIYQSQTTGLNQTYTFTDSPYISAGFCKRLSAFPIEKEIACKQLSRNECASTACCLLLGGEKCVSGNARGPNDKSNYSDFLVKNRGYYYFQGQCYGNCP